MFRGPRLRTKLMLLGVALLIVPWFSYRQLVEMEAFLVNGQAQAQLLTAEGISTLLNGRADLFNDLPLSLEDYASLYAHPLTNPIRIDGRAADWQALLDRSRHFASGGEASVRDGSFDVVLGERGGQLYAHVRIYDAEPVYRNPDYLRLDNSDHLRVSFTHHDGRDGRLVITFTAPGLTTAYHMNSDWRLAETGQPENRVIGAVEALEDGYSIEFRLPLDMLGTHRHFGLSFVDVDDTATREIRSITQTLPKAGEESFNLVVLRSPEVLKVISGLGYAGARVIVVDPQKRVRADTGAYQALGAAQAGADDGAWQDVFAPMVRWLIDIALRGQAVVTNATQISDSVIDSSLAGKPIALRRYFPNGEESIMAAHPIIALDKVIGTVIVEQNTNQILAIQRQALERIVLVSVLSLLGVFVLLLAFSVRLAWRIRNLGTETSEAIDPRGRLRTSQIRSEAGAGDEIGDLARSISGMLSRLHQHNQFLENMPRTLRHEINNPLNTLMTSIQNLEADIPEVAGSKYLDSAKRGAMRIGSIIQNLADAASLEESLDSEDLEIIDLNELLANYVNNCALMHPRCEFVYRGAQRPVYANVADYRIEQLLDKIIDNAIDFRRKDSPIRVQLDVERDSLVISVTNRGPLLPPSMEDSLFDSMVSQRSDMSDNKLHFGLGLYVVRVIAEHHKGSVSARNLEDGSGVVISVRLPLADAPGRTSREWGASRTGGMPKLRLDGAPS